jgi:hypothetical protein
MSGLLYNVGGFHAQGTEIHGVLISEEQATFGTEPTPNSQSLLPAQIQSQIGTAVVAGQNLTGLYRATT